MEYEIRKLYKDEFEIVKAHHIVLNWHGCKLRSIPQIAYEVERISSE